MIFWVVRVHQPQHVGFWPHSEIHSDTLRSDFRKTLAQLRPDPLWAWGGGFLAAGRLFRFLLKLDLACISLRFFLQSFWCPNSTSARFSHAAMLAAFGFWQLLSVGWDLKMAKMLLRLSHRWVVWVPNRIFIFCSSQSFYCIIWQYFKSTWLLPEK